MMSSIRSVVAALSLSVGLAAACGVDSRVVGVLPAAEADAGTPGFTHPNDVDAALEGERPLMCIATECPEPWTTCITENGPTYKCGTDLQRDNANCGACGNKCTMYLPLNMTSRCVSGACELQCYVEPTDIGLVDWRDCNGLVDDGCEVDVIRDTDHCGACGNKCPAGVPCLEGRCGCPAGRIYCSGSCVDPQEDDRHCGGCNIVCTRPTDACDDPHTMYGCSEGHCGRKKCERGFGPAYYDCNGDLSPTECGGDGCEVAGLDTKDNCGACGRKCTKPNEECVDEGNGPECAVPCERFGRVLCNGECIDLLTDVRHCGACGKGCRPPGAHQVRSCSKGVCMYECEPGWDDCNGSSVDGCEANLSVHPLHCGACGNACNGAAGQPCVEGKCLMKECDAGVVQ